MTTAAPGRVPGWLLAAETRRAVEEHDRWDSPHQFILFRWDGRRVSRCDVQPISPDATGRADMTMIRTAGKWLQDHPGDPPCAYLLRVECHGITKPGPDAAPAVLSRFDADRRLRGFAARPDAVEACAAWCVDTEGRMWNASKTRGGGPGGGDSPVTVTPYSGDARVGGQYADVLRAVAATTALLVSGP